MTNQELDHLFASAKTTPSQTSVEEITTWVGVAASATGILGIAAKLKLIIAKKTFIMLGSTLGTIGIVAVSVALLGSSPSENTTIPSGTSFVETQNESSLPPEIESIHVSSKKELTLDEEAPTEPVMQGNEPSMVLPFLSPLSLSQINSGKLPSLATMQTGKPIKGNGKVVTQDRAVSPFKKLEVLGIFDVIIKSGDKEAVSVKADENLQEFILVENDGDKLTLSVNQDIKSKDNEKIIIYVTVKNLTDLTAAGIGDVTTESRLDLNNLNVDVTGVGDVVLDLSCSSLNLDHSGVGDVQLKGSATSAHYDYNGVGDILAFEFEVKELELDHSGVGETNVYATEKLSIDFSGVGSVRYKGNPSDKKIDKSGIGSVKAK